ncbi:MAG: glutamyl-tRNA reductase [Candidatus Omnitrophica bacterium]|nr:glutamyl-tRNA reductase [Candidatus Omnitrophota bacterium]
MRLSVVGVSHRTAPVAVRERLAVASRDLATVVAEVQACGRFGAAVILSTCNRVEYYVTTAPAPSCPSPAARLIEWLAVRSGMPVEALRPHLYALADDAVVRHLFRVTAGLDSMVLGESEIAAQVKQAYLMAQAAGATDPSLNRAFQSALHAAKVDRARTAIGAGSASVGSVVVELARARFGGRLDARDALLWGAGKAAETTARHLLKQGVGQLWVVNRTADRAQALATLCRGMWLSWEEALRHLDHVDIAIVCTQAPHYVIDAADVEAAWPRRGGKPLFLADLSVPRNIDPALKRRPGVSVYDMDDVQSLARQGVARRRLAVAQGEALLHHEVEKFERWRHPFIHQGGVCALSSSRSG